MSLLSTKRLRLTSVLMLLAILLICPANVVAIPLTDYHRNLQRAIQSLETLKETDEDEEDYETRLSQVNQEVRDALPAQQSVETEGETVNVENAWLHKSLDEMNNSSDWAAKHWEILETLRALENRVTERQQPGRLVENKQDAKTRLDSILARPEYTTGPRGPNALTRLMQDIAKWLQKFLPQPRSIDPGRLDLVSVIVRIVVLALAALVIGFVIKTLLVWFWGRKQRIKKPKKQEARVVLGERLEPDATATDLLADAETLARQGDLRAAIRKAYIALLVELGDRKLISLAHHKTNRDYLNSLRNVPPIHAQMRGLTDSFERHWYGFANVTATDWQDFRAGYIETLRG
jgi:Domain of unknown function (DUF4129)